MRCECPDERFAEYDIFGGPSHDANECPTPARYTVDRDGTLLHVCVDCRLPKDILVATL